MVAYNADAGQGTEIDIVVGGIVAVLAAFSWLLARTGMTLAVPIGVEGHQRREGRRFGRSHGHTSHRRTAMTRRHWTSLLAVVALLIGSCGGAEETLDEPVGVAPTSPAALALRIEHSGGLAGSRLTAGQIPVLSAYADGRLITPGPQILIYPAPALPSVQVQRIGADAVAGLAAAAVGAGVRPGVDFGNPGVAGATTTVVTTVTAHGVNRVAVVALGETPPPGTDLTEAQRAARAELEDFVQRAIRLPTSPRAPEAERYRAAALAVLAVPYAPPGDNLPSRPATRPWPGPELPGADLPGDSGAGCTVVTGEDADRLRTAASDASVITAWTSGGASWNVTFRPLLPDERTCGDLLPPT